MTHWSEKIFFRFFFSFNVSSKNGFQCTLIAPARKGYLSYYIASKKIILIILDVQRTLIRESTNWRGITFYRYLETYPLVGSKQTCILQRHAIHAAMLLLHQNKYSIYFISSVFEWSHQIDLNLYDVHFVRKKKSIYLVR